ncbi:TonB-dependent receptor [Sphingomonas zeicaulis]|uniref:TonB-dependent receptor n=1 Tax=Sphingomonas zeicaulis TaxID=1632740 RepID=UPI003D1E848B
MHRGKRAILLGTCLAGLGTPAFAQDAAAQSEAQSQKQTEDIIVTGVRRSLEEARTIKRDSAQFVDAVVASDIGALPDANVAESLARVSGVQIDRGIGEGTNIAIRGLRENVLLYNGREIFDSTGRGGTGVDELSTSTYGLLSLVPSELVSQLQVTKLAGADQIAGALGGIVDIGTRTALDSKGFHLTASAGGVYDALPKRMGYEVFGLISDTFANDTIGVLLSVSRSQRYVGEQGLSTFSGYGSFTAGGIRRTGHTDVRAQQIEDDRSRTGVSAVVQWRPDATLEVKADTFYSRLESDRGRYWLAFNPTQGLRDAIYSDENVLLSGTAVTTPNTNAAYFGITSEVWSSALSLRYEATDALTLSGQLSYGLSTATSSRDYIRLTLPASANRPIAFDLTEGAYGAYDLGVFDLTDPAGMNVALLYDDNGHVRTRDIQGRGDATYRFTSPVFESVQFGARYVGMETSNRPENVLLRPNLPASGFINYLSIFENDDFLPGDFAGLPRSYLIGGADQIASCRSFTEFPQISQSPECLNPSQSLSSLGNTYDVREEFWNTYLKLNLRADLGFAEFQGNIGLRYIGRDLTSVGFVLDSSGVASPTTFRRSDDDFLPSAVARLTFNDNLVLRLGYAKVQAFPRTGSLTNGVSLNNDAVFENGVQIQPGTGGGGSPNLDPYEATQYDASLEYYFGSDALVSAAYFYKDVASFLISSTSAERYGNVDFLIGRQINGGNGKIQGVELLYQQPFTFLPSPLDGFGIIATYSYIDSETPFTTATGERLTYPGLSKNNVNIIGYYEKGPLNVRLAYNWRDRFLGGLNGAAGTAVYSDTYQDLAGSIRYNINDNVELRVEGINLLESRQRTFDLYSDALRTNVTFGRVFKFGVQVSF